MAFLLMHLHEIEPVSNRICLTELQKMRGFSFHRKGNKDAALPVHLDWLSLKLKVVETQTKPPTTIDLYMNSFTQEQQREPRKCLQLALPMT